MNGGMSMGGRHGGRMRAAGWGLAALLLLTPAVAMRFTSEVDWTLGDFVFAGVLIGGVGLLAEVAVRASRSRSYRAAAALALATAFLTVWINAAVGVIGSEDNPLNLLFMGVVALGLIGALVARLRPEDIARAMTVTAIAQGVVAVVALLHDVRGFVLGGFFAVLWLGSAWLFRRAARVEG